MSLQNIEFDKHGDIKLRVGKTDPVTFTACSRALARTSPVFERMLYGGFIESKKPDDEEWVVSLPEDKATAMALFLHISHGQFDRIPRTLSMDDLYDLTVLSNYYDGTRMLEPWIERWMDSIENNAKQSKEAMTKYLWITFEFGYKDSFARMARHMVMESEGSEDANLQMVPDIVERISEIRILIIQTLLDVINQLVEDLLVVDEKPRTDRNIPPAPTQGSVLGLLRTSVLTQWADTYAIFTKSTSGNGEYQASPNTLVISASGQITINGNAITSPQFVIGTILQWTSDSGNSTSGKLWMSNNTTTSPLNSATGNLFCGSILYMAFLPPKHVDRYGFANSPSSPDDPDNETRMNQMLRHEKMGCCRQHWKPIPPDIL
ncbi:hypothetical protein FVEN_g5630 [Fusarium venenatum]|nr:hypothetical protein FVEN_g5630 [Fusarium venenatum]